MKTEDLSIGNVVLFNGVPKVLQKEDFTYLYDYVDASVNDCVKWYKPCYMNVGDGVEMVVDVEQYDVTPMPITEELLVNEQGFKKIGDKEYLLEVPKEYTIKYCFEAFRDSSTTPNMVYIISSMKRQDRQFLHNANVIVDDFHVLQNVLKLFDIQLKTDCYNNCVEDKGE